MDKKPFHIFSLIVWVSSFAQKNKKINKEKNKEKKRKKKERKEKWWLEWIIQVNVSTIVDAHLLGQ